MCLLSNSRNKSKTHYLPFATFHHACHQLHFHCFSLALVTCFCFPGPAAIYLFLLIKRQHEILNVLIIIYGYLISLNHNVYEFMSLSPVLARHKGQGGAFSPEVNEQEKLRQGSSAKINKASPHK